MPYARELDSLRQEVRKDTAGTIVFWPKVNGLNVQVVTSNTFQVFDPSGVSVEGPTAIDGTLVTDVDRFDIPVAAIGTLDEGYYVELLWTQAGASEVQRSVILFDCVLYPYGPPSVSLNEMLEERPDAGEVLDRHGQLLGQSAGEASQEYAAAIYSMKARVELDALIRAQMQVDGGVRPRLILNRERLNRVEAKLAMREMYAADFSGSDDSEGLSLYEHYKAEADRAWASVGPLKYDSSEDLSTEETIDNIGRVVIQRRT